MLSSLTVTAALTGVLKTMIPDGRPSGGSHDFPSGHSSMSMAAAATLDGLYGHSWGVPAYCLATLVGLQRLDTGKHDSGAVVFGWALGYVVGHTLAKHHAPRIFGMDVGVLVDPETGGVGLALPGGL
jgi:membrane-associated phospholipid phosphatase